MPMTTTKAAGRLLSVEACRLIAKAVTSFRDGGNRVGNRASLIFLVAGAIVDGRARVRTPGAARDLDLPRALRRHVPRDAARHLLVPTHRTLAVDRHRRRTHAVRRRRGGAYPARHLRQPHHDPIARPRPHHHSGLRPVRGRARGSCPASPPWTGREFRRASSTASIAALAAVALAWVFLITPTLSHEQTPVTVRLLLSCYPPLSVFLVAITAHIAFSPATRRVPAYSFLLFTMGAMLVGDTIFMLLETAAITMPFALIDLPYAIAYVALGVGSTPPVHARAVDAGERRPGRTEPRTSGIRRHRARHPRSRHPLAGHRVHRRPRRAHGDRRQPHRHRDLAGVPCPP